MTDFFKLKMKRGVCKSALTRHNTFLNSINNVDIDDNIFNQLKIRLSKLEIVFKEFNAIQEDIELILQTTENVDQKEADEEFSERDTFENNYFSLFARSSSIINEYQEHIFELRNSRIPQFVPQVVPQNPQSTSNIVKLPSLKLPTFSGSCEKWLEFADAFLSLIDKNQSLDDVQKFYYLRSSLESEAAQLLESIQVTGNNYNLAWSILKERYENKKLIIYNYVKALFDAPALARESHSELRKLYDNFNKNIRSLKILGEPTEHWDTLLIFLLNSKFDSRTTRDWESFKISNDLPTMADMNSFLKGKCELLENLDTHRNEQRRPLPPKQNTQSYYTGTEQNKKFSCFYCKGEHTIYKCESFLQKDTPTRINETKRLQLCFNCLNPNHNVAQCDRSGCRVCSRKHNSLHQDRPKSDNTATPATATPAITMGIQAESAPANDTYDNTIITLSENHTTETDNSNIISTQNNVAAHSANFTNNYAILSTAMVNIKTHLGKTIRARMLLDPGSQSNFINDEFCNKLGAKRLPANFLISGVGNNSLAANYKTDIKICSINGDFSKLLSCLIMNKITQPIPIVDFDPSFLNIPKNIKMADPDFYLKREIDILCGVGLFYDILLMNQIKLEQSLTLQNTRLGWILGGEIGFALLNTNKLISCHARANDDLDDSLNKGLLKFWQIEECNNVAKPDNFCDKHFKENFSRDNNGHFIVKIPFKDNIIELGHSKDIALKRFELLERRLLKNEDLKLKYAEFMNEYLMLGHMTEIVGDLDDLEDCNAYYLPHHAIVKDSLTTKLRVVFDASAKTDTNLSLNDVQHIGPTIQNDLFTILINFRKYAFVMSADISKMYRQIFINPEQRRFQRIFWRNSDKENLKCYQLNTVTYGTASAPYLAIRCLQQLAIENEIKYPAASNIIKNCFYVDDLLTGQDSESELLKLQREIISILNGAGLQLRKWICNKPELCDKFEIIDGLKANVLQLGEAEQNKTLGIYWNANSDIIQYRIRDIKDNKIVTKRLILSTTSQIFDPLGLVGPVVIIAKLILQSLWREKLTWDQEVPKKILDKWKMFYDNLPNLQSLSIPRHVSIHNPGTVQLHFFADASEKAYGACAYVRSTKGEEVYTRLLCAKSKVAPIKEKTLTLARLELCAAVLAVNLSLRVTDSLNLECYEIFYWSDSMITLHWINGSSERWKVFVAHRVGFIQSNTDIKKWYHIKSEHNPADIISRGTTTTQLLENQLWWEGPCWLKLDQSQWYYNDRLNNNDLTEIPEQRITCSVAIKPPDLNIFDDIFKQYSSLQKLLRIIAVWKRFMFNCKNAKSKMLGPLTAKELQDSLLTLIKISQKQSFHEDYKNLQKDYYIKKSSSLSSLNPFLKDDLIRVGGRIQRAKVPYNQRHPIVLHNKHPLTIMIMTNEHKRMLHCGPQQLLYSIRASYWPISGRSLAKTIVHKCITCFKVKPKLGEFLMGNLPSERVNQFTPFLNTACDYAGPFILKDRKTKKPCLTKAWVCIFVCMSTKAVHLELITDLSSDSFLACFKRFVARRGKPANMFSDNGTNFVGADSQLKDFFKSQGDNISRGLASEAISWHYIPARAPHFGGLWEAGVKVLKHHLKRTIGINHLHYEDFMTILTQIEAIMNSRPLCPLSSSPDDYTPLTPGHFLIGKPLTAIPEPCVVEVPENRLKHYKKLQQMVQQYWQRWTSEYISELQCRMKWKEKAASMINVDDLVLVKEDNLPPLRWRTARVIQLHPGEDNVTRVVTIRFSDGAQTKRSLNKVCFTTKKLRVIQYPL